MRCARQHKKEVTIISTGRSGHSKTDMYLLVHFLATTHILILSRLTDTGVAPSGVPYLSLGVALTAQYLPYVATRDKVLTR